FKLAELLWEDARRRYVVAMDRWERARDACVARPGCTPRGRPPELDLREPEALYRTLLAEHPDFRRIDLVLYLVGFAAREDGRGAEAEAVFRRLVAEHPRSPLYADAWMMLGEERFQAEDWAAARAAYLEVVARPDARAYDLALFKTAWCE